MRLLGAVFLVLGLLIQVLISGFISALNVFELNPPDRYITVSKVLSVLDLLSAVALLIGAIALAIGFRAALTGRPVG